VNLQEIDEKIAKAEHDWRVIADPEVKRVAEDICKELYAEKRVLEEAARRDKISRN